MKRCLTVFATIVIATQSLPTQALTPAGKARVAALESRSIPALTMPPMQTWMLANGWHVILLEDHDLPLVSAQVMIRASTAFVEKDKVGTAGLLTRILRSGGTQATPPDQLDEELDRMAVRISDSMSGESASVTLNTLSEYVDPAFRHFFNVIFTPRFDQNRFDGVKRRRLDEIRRQNDSPSEIAQREFITWLEGDSPWGWVPTRKSVANVGIQDVREYYQKHFIHGEKWVVVVGDITRPKLEAILKPAAALDQGPAVMEKLPQLTLPKTPGVRIVNKKATQTTIVMGHAGTDRHNPDKYALLVMNDILGGAPFTNRLMKAIRTERGLAYSVNSNFGFGPKEAPGLFTAFAMTKADKTGEVVGLMKKIIEQVRAGEGITEEALSISKRSIMSGLLFEMASPFNAASQQARFEMYGYPPNYAQEFRRNVMKVTVADVKRVAQQYLHPDQLRILAVGTPKVLTPQLEKFGPVEVIQPLQ
jgi:zinc protease